MTAQRMSVDHDYLVGLIQRVDTSIPSLDWSDRDTVLVNYLQFLENFYLVEMPKLVAVYGQDAADAIQDKTSSAANYIVRWIHRQGIQGEDQSKTRHSVTAEEVERFDRIQTYAVQYSEIRDWENVAYEKFYAVEAVSASHLQATYQDEDRKCGQAAEWLLKGLQRLNGACQFDPSALVKDALGNSQSTEEFFVPVEHVRELMATPNPHFESLWRMDPSTSFKSFTLADFRAFWCAVYALSDIQTNLVRIVVAISGFPFNKVLLRMTRDAWLQKLQDLSRLALPKLEALLDLMVYESNQTETAEVALQPFFKLDDDSIVMSNFLVRTANAESNLFALWTRKYEKHYGSIASKKESWWVSQKRPELEKKGFLTRGPVVFSNKQKEHEGDIDLFILHPRSKVALCCQLKWYLVPDRFHDSNVEKVLEAVQQALDAVAWLKADPDRAQATLSIKKALLKDVELLPLVISRDWMLNGIRWSTDVPLVSEALFDYLLKLAPIENPLRALWECASQRTYLPVVGEDFSVRSRTIELGGIRLDYERLEGVPDVQWSPDRIKFPAIDNIISSSQ